LDIKLFDFELPEKLIAQTPLESRDQSRMLFINKADKTYSDEHFFNIISNLRPGDVIVRNNTRVIPARLFGTKESTNAHVELLLLNPVGPDTYECIVGNAKVVKPGTHIVFLKDILEADCLEIGEEGIRVVKFTYSSSTLLEALEVVGQTPLPPYIKEKLVDQERYQTIYAKEPGSAAAPTAGLHFTKSIDDKIKALGVTILEITLHVGLGTFRPVKVNDTNDHVMHYEHYEINIETAKLLNIAKDRKQRIIAVGTTTLRTLEANYRKFSCFKAEKSKTDLFITPGSKILSIDGLLTNFHLPKSTLIMLISSFIGREFTLELYRHAIEKEYRFFSFGDCMLIL